MKKYGGPGGYKKPDFRMHSLYSIKEIIAKTKSLNVFSSLSMNTSVGGSYDDYNPLCCEIKEEINDEVGETEFLFVPCVKTDDGLISKHVIFIYTSLERFIIAFSF
ncbi:uncharacterized protein LOC142324169 isoform X2 [Lycorma delicatula]|uniref:uncharacterized protein LOC142324169 isoform X2 n=1 Tax=Lycorma delicatula TaxID=130591 RepID=UPI003F513B38